MRSGGGEDDPVAGRVGGMTSSSRDSLPPILPVGMQVASLVEVYLGFAETQWKLFEKDRPRRVKPLLYVYRVLLTGIHLMRSGEIEANLVRLNEEAKLVHVRDLIAQKTGDREQSTLADDAFAFHAAEYARLRAALEAAHAASGLREAAEGGRDLDALLVRLRIGSG